MSVAQESRTMMLLDHFRGAVSVRRHWHSFHNAWATFLASDLNARLPKGYFAESHVQFGIEIDVATFEEMGGAEGWSTWTPPHPTLTIPLPVVTDSAEVLVFESSAGPVLAGAIELVSPANKDRPASRDAFTSKCAAYLQSGVGVVVVDIVTERVGDLQRALLARLDAPQSESTSDLHAASYRPVGRPRGIELDIWHEPLALGGPLPTLPFWLKGGPVLPLDLGATYDRTRRELRMVEGF